MTNVVVLYGNQPSALPVSMIRLLSGTGNYRVRLIYFNRVDSPVSIPMTTRLGGAECCAITGRVGKGVVSKVVNRIIAIGQFIRRLREFDPDVIEAWSFDVLVAARLASGRRSRAKIVFALEDTTAWMLWHPLKALQRWAYRGVDLFFVPSEGFEAEFLRKFRLIPEDAEVVFIPNVPPSSMFVDFSPRQPCDSLVVGYIGAFRGREGIGTLVEAVRIARDRGADIRVLFAGTGIDRDFVNAMGEAHDFVDVRGPYDYDKEISGLYRSVDLIYALYDRSYDKRIHLAYRLCEGINCQLPVIVAKDTHMSRLVESLGVGVSVTLGDAEELAETLIDLWKDPGKRSRIAGNCRAIRRQFVFESYEGKILEAYGRLCAAQVS